ncbi:sensor histidine kinase [Algoriphagus namhaensis]
MMKSKSLDFKSIEWWVVTFLFLIILLVNILNIGSTRFDLYDHELINYFAKIFIPLILFAVFYVVHMRLIPAYQRSGKLWVFLAWCVPIALSSYIGITLFSVGGEITETAFTPYYFKSLAIYGGYLVWVVLLKQIFLPPKMENFQLYNSIRLGSIFFFLLLFVVQISVIFPRGLSQVFAIGIPAIAAVILYNYLLIYRFRRKGKSKLANAFNIFLIAALPGGFILGATAEGQPILLLIGVGLALFIQLILIPISNFAFDKYFKMRGQIKELNHQVQVGSANLSFLKSQINPHFLFNALNTLYGSALIENAEKTSDAIQKLGDMMRFMLHENTLDKIPLKRELEYLQNYLDLQMLRFKNEENLDVQVHINEETCIGHIAPMMLIPFVENAFKHGISTKNKSWIKINLRCLKGSVHLDVVNSIHPPKSNPDPSDESGVGLDNVKQRLSVLYPDRHKLNIVANDSEYFVHFSLQLDQND